MQRDGSVTDNLLMLELGPAAGVSHGGGAFLLRTWVSLWGAR